MRSPWRATRPCCSCPSGRTPPARSGWTRATAPAGSRPMPGSNAPTPPTAGRAALLASLDYAWDPAWLKAMRSRPRTVLTLGGKPVLVHVPDGRRRRRRRRRSWRRARPPTGYEMLAVRDRRAQIMPSCASATGRSSCRSTRTIRNRSNAPPTTRRTRALPTSSRSICGASRPSI